MNKLTELKAQAYDLIALREDVERRLIETNKQIIAEMEIQQQEKNEELTRKMKTEE